MATDALREVRKIATVFEETAVAFEPRHGPGRGSQAAFQRDEVDRLG